jgi:hypothetical protein
MKTLGEAWVWYRAVKVGMSRLAHLSKYWDDLPWSTGADWIAQLERDNVLKATSATELAAEAKLVKDQLDDLAVFVLFSVFESIIRDLVVQKVRPEVDQIRHTALKKVGMDFLEELAEGSFFQVLQPFKTTDTHDAIEKVNKVRKYRNWVAHGRRGDEPIDNVRPEDAYEWLQAFVAIVRTPELTALQSPPEGESDLLEPPT